MLHHTHVVPGILQKPRPAHVPVQTQLTLRKGLDSRSNSRQTYQTDDTALSTHIRQGRATCRAYSTSMSSPAHTLILDYSSRRL